MLSLELATCPLTLHCACQEEEEQQLQEQQQQQPLELPNAPLQEHPTNSANHSHAPATAAEKVEQTLQADSQQPNILQEDAMKNETPEFQTPEFPTQIRPEEEDIFGDDSAASQPSLEKLPEQHPNGHTGDSISIQDSTRLWECLFDSAMYITSFN